MLKINNITKQYKTRKTETPKLVLKGINTEIKAGEIYGLIGANGAGKTTLMNIISQLINATSGTIEINGKEIKSLNELRGRIGYMIDIPAMHEYLTAMEYLEYIASPNPELKGEELKKRSLELLEQVGLTEAANRRIKGFSRGMKQRMGIAAGLITNPPIILMDEPSSALDPQGRYEVVEIIKNLAKSGKTIILSTHILADVEKVCTKVGLLVNGNLVIEGTLKEVMDAFAENAYKVICHNEKEIKKVIMAAKKSLKFLKAEEIDAYSADIYFKEDGAKSIFEAISKAEAEIDSVQIKRASMEEIFLKTNIPKKATEELDEKLGKEEKVSTKRKSVLDSDALKKEGN